MSKNTNAFKGISMEVARQALRGERETTAVEMAWLIFATAKMYAACTESFDNPKMARQWFALNEALRAEFTRRYPSRDYLFFGQRFYRDGWVTPSGYTRIA